MEESKSIEPRAEQQPERVPAENADVKPMTGYAAKKSLKQLQRQERRAQELREREAHLSAASKADDIALPTHTLAEGLPDFPPIVFGTHMLQHEVAEKAIYDALMAGYRGIDTASRYFNEEQVAAAIKRSGVPRKDIFLITKIGPQDTKRGRAAIIKSFLESLRKLETSYVDCYLMHWPGVGGIAPEDPAAVPKRIEAWRTMAELKRRGLVRYIGVSNYKLRHFLSLEEAAAREKEEEAPHAAVGEEANNPTIVTPQEGLYDVPSLPLPDVHQTELHPLCKQLESSQYCFDKGIRLQQYSPLAKTDPRLFSHPSMVEAVDKLKAIFEKEKVPLLTAKVTTVSAPAGSTTLVASASTAAEVIEVTPSLICLLWGRYKGYVSAAVRSTNPQRIAMNLAAPIIYDRCVAPYGDRVGILSELDAALANEEDVHTCWESSKVY